MIGCVHRIVGKVRSVWAQHQQPTSKLQVVRDTEPQWKCMCVSRCVSSRYLDLQGTCSGRPCPAPRPERGPQVSARRPTSAPAAETGRPSSSLKHTVALFTSVSPPTHTRDSPCCGGSTSCLYLLLHWRLWAARYAGTSAGPSY